MWVLPKLRGLWCGVCFIVWRFRYEARIRRVTMPAVFNASHEVLTDFELSLVAFVSLRRDGVHRVESTQLAARCELIKWVLGVFGMPCTSFTVRALADVEELPSVMALMMMASPDSQRVGAMVLVSQPSSRHSILRPTEDGMMQLKSRALLHTDNPADDVAHVARLTGNRVAPT